MGTKLETFVMYPITLKHVHVQYILVTPVFVRTVHACKDKEGMYVLLYSVLGIFSFIKKINTSAVSYHILHYIQLHSHEHVCLKQSYNI